MLRARAGDARAFDRLVERHGRLVLSVARNLLGHREDAEDVAQEVFLRFYRSLGRFDPSRPVEPWLVRITVNCARSHRRRRDRDGMSSLEDTPGEPAAPRGKGPGAALDAAEVRAALRAGLATLPERERLVFVLRDVQGLEVTVVAEALGVSPVTVRRQSMEGRKKLLAWLRAHRPDLVRLFS